jgi:DNA-binding YbaB/EbfC family protein
MSRGFGGFPGGNMQGLLQQAQKMQKDMQRAQQEAEAFEAEGSAGGGAVKIKARGTNEILSVTIAPEAVDPSDVEVLQEMILLAANAALAEVRKNSEEKLSKVTGGMKIPGML